MSDDKEKPKPQGIPLGSFFDPKSIESMGRTLKIMADFQASIGRMAVRQSSPLIQAALAAGKMLEDVKTAAEKAAFLSKYTVGHSPHLGLYGGISKGLYDVEEAIDVFPEILEDESSEIEPSEKQRLLRQIEELKNEIRFLRQQPEARERLKIKKKSKRSRSQYSDDEKLQAVKEWMQLEKSKNPITVIDWLADRFQDKNGIPNVSKSTFYSWKKRFEDNGDI